ncbi:MAG: hypothetical protein II371_01275 [Flavobacteriales bacterium]|jgi:hypothetical protein|nr:hypothetical protein [Flavobacteriales bacterium]
MAFPSEFVRFGKIEFSSCYVFLYSSAHNRRALSNVPPGIVNAWWQGSSVAVETSGGWVYMYTDFGSYSSKYMK